MTLFKMFIIFTLFSLKYNYAKDYEKPIDLNIYCSEQSHRDVFPVNPHCSKCNNIDGIVRHKCTNPDGEDKYCTSCGKIILGNE